MVFYDFEVFKYDWLVVFYDLFSDSFTIIVNDSDKLSEFYSNHKQCIYTGYNSRNYDQWIYKGILAGYDPYDINDYIINKGGKGYQYSRNLNKYKIIGYDCYYMFSSLKSLEAFQGYNIHETSVPFSIDRKLTQEELNDTIKYCKDDVLNTVNVFFKTRQEFDSKLALVTQFDLPLSYINKTQAQLASVILGAKAKEYNDEWEIRLPKNAKVHDYKKVCSWFLSDKAKEKKAKLNVDIYGVPHVFAWGGLHGAIKKYTHDCDSDEVLVMADVDQLYPTLMIEYNLLSRSVKDKGKFKYVLDESLRLKKAKRKKEREPYKRICNITYGAEGDKYNGMYDPLHRNLVCVYGQIFLLDLIEKLKGFKLIQSNTDGILYLIKKNQIEEFKAICEEWSNRTHLNLSYDFYKRIRQKDVNNYVLVDENQNIKSKGAYVKQLSDLDNDLPIVNKAVKLFLAYDIPPEETIYSPTNKLIDYQKIYKLSSKYNCVWHDNERYTNKVYRVFASRDKNHTYLGKQKREGTTIEKFANSPDHCIIINDDITEKPVIDTLDRTWYYDIAKKRISEFI